MTKIYLFFLFCGSHRCRGQSLQSRHLVLDDFLWRLLRLYYHGPFVPPDRPGLVPLSRLAGHRDPMSTDTFHAIKNLLDQPSISYREVHHEPTPTSAATGTLPLLLSNREEHERRGTYARACIFMKNLVFHEKSCIFMKIICFS